jgi:hypothetical protein
MGVEGLGTGLCMFFMTIGWGYIYSALFANFIIYF